jgi:hypothetical protein
MTNKKNYEIIEIPEVGLWTYSSSLDDVEY